MAAAAAATGIATRHLQLLTQLASYECLTNFRVLVPTAASGLH